MLFKKIFVTWLLLNVSALSLPLHQVNLQSKKVFELASDNKNYDEQNENEMIHPADLTNLNLHIEDESRYKPLHSYVDNYNKHEFVNKIQLQYTNTAPYLKSNTWGSSYAEKDDTPFIAGFKEDLDKVKFQNLYRKSFQRRHDNKRNNSLFWKKINSTVIINKNKRRSTSPNTFEDFGYIDSTELDEKIYDYDQLKKEYEGQIEEDINSNKTLNFIDDEKLEEQPKEILKKLVDFKNCSKVIKKFNIKPINCLIYNYDQQKHKPIIKKILRKIWLITKIWVLIYICFAIPCWCQKGWCCCCFRFKFCFPKKRILYAKQYYVNNPPGIFNEQVQRTEKIPITYIPTTFEEDMYEKLETAIRNI